VGLRHRVLGAVEAIEHELAEKGEADGAGDVEVAGAFAVDDEDVVAAIVARDVDVFAQLDVAVGAEDEGAAVAPGGETVGREPVDAQVAGRAAVADEGRLPEILEFGPVGVRVVGDGGARSDDCRCRKGCRRNAPVRRTIRVGWPC
jgi:hypothetical protein